MSNVLNPIDPVEAIESKRRLIYGSLMLYSAESIPLRDRALEATMLAALVGASADHPLKNGDIQHNLRAGIGNIDLRPELIRHTLDQLVKKGLVVQVEQRQKPVYYLSEDGEARTREGAREAKSLFQPVLSEILANAGDNIDTEQATAVLEDFICTSFARFGASIAGFLAGRRPHLANSLELSITFDEIAAKHFVPGDSLESLKARCMGVFKVGSQAARRLMFHLTQGYCFAQLLGLDRADFNPITEEAFRGSIFYFDTNVLIAGLLPGDRGEALAEILGIARRVGAELRVTRATIDETRYTAAEKLKTLEKIAASVPEEVGKLSADEFVSHFYDLRRDNPALTPAEFLANFDSIADVVRDRWGVVLEERTEDSLLKGADAAEIEDIVQNATVASRGYRKNDHVLRHDVAHLMLIRDARKATPKIWFLTRDGALISAAADLARNDGTPDRPLCFSMLGFLQSISPFVSSSVEDNVLANFFSALLTEQVFVPEKLFDDRELALIAETHADVMAMPPDQVVLAVDYVKRHILKGDKYRTETVPIVALELRKFLSANAEERQRTLQVVADENKDRYRAARRQMMRERQLREEYEGRLQKTEEELEKTRSDMVSQQEEIDSIKRRQTRRTLRERRIFVAIVCIAAGIVLHYFSPDIAGWLGAAVSLTPQGLARLAMTLRLAKMGLFLLPLLFFVPAAKIKPDARTALIAAVVIGWLWLGGVQASETFGKLSDVATIALYLTLFLTNKRD